ncbi:hypothetical protein PR202_gb27546 [Eleusine coracana subsp. coracana]|uniref:DUF295 domain-containing protein n=1 Tax=Eleusine coracana subsp. coracana TaxID=191504 RepID=A0AAV5FS52_ELECO|nr:hypothetical protein PR202_gb27546 [Eleusine coracana subsp. coracana]
MSEEMAASPELRRLMEQEKEQLMAKEMISKLTNVCWDKCVTASSARPPPATRLLVAAEAEERDWTSLHRDITKLIADRLLDEDVTEYIVFRVVCKHWRASTPSPRDPTLADRRFHPRDWVALCEGTGVRPVDDEAITFFNWSSGKVRRVHLWELQGHRIVGFTDGLIVLLDTGRAVVRVLHPFTRVIVQLPTLAGFFHRVLSKQAWFKMDSFIWLNGAVCVASPSSIVVVIWFPGMPVVICAEPNSGKDWRVLHINIQFSNTLPFNADVPEDLGLAQSCCYHLVESMGTILLCVLRKVIAGDCSNAFALFKVDLYRKELTRVLSLGDRALFLSDDRCLSVSARDLPSIGGNCIYFTLPDPFTLADHLITYCHHREWARGLMFHEFYFIPTTTSWDNLRKRIAIQDSEVVVPRLQGLVDPLRMLEIPDLLGLARSFDNHGNRASLTT